MQPDISVIMPVYNGASYLQDALDSLWNQTFTNFECIIINDGSTDTTKEILDAQSDKRLLVLNNETNSGVSFSLNKGLQMAGGRYIARMDADDICFPERFAIQKNFLDNNPEVMLVDCIMEYIDSVGKPMGKVYSEISAHKDLVKKIPFQNCIGHSSVMFRNEIKQLGYNKLPLEDLDLWFRIINKGWIIHRIPILLLYYRIHESSVINMYKNASSIFFKLSYTKRMYLSNLPFMQRFRLFNLKVFVGMIMDHLTGIYKRAK